jgi:predicted amidohydrolase
LDEADQRMNVHAWTFDVGATATTPLDYAEHCISRVEASWDQGADLVLFPEYTWAGLEPLLSDPTLQGVARCFWEEIWPRLQQRLARPGKAVVLGTAPWFDNKSGKLLNRAPIFIEGKSSFQDKLCLTPWEAAFSPGEHIQLLHFKGWRMAVLVCLDVEIAELSQALRGQQLDLLLVPSATETLMGVERVNRCASARAVELGCNVVVSHLMGQSSSSLIDENVGSLSFYLPSQSYTAGKLRQQNSEIYASGFHLAQFELSKFPAQELLLGCLETNPALLAPRQVPPVIA